MFNCPERPVWSDIAPAFSAEDIACMKVQSSTWPTPLDLSDYASVYANRDTINAAVVSGNMPQDPDEQPNGLWPPLECWQRWYALGYPET